WWGIASQMGQVAFADGTTINLNRNWGQNLTFTWVGSPAATLTGSQWGNNVFEIGANDVVNGAAGFGNIYEFGKGDAPVTVNVSPAANTTNTIQLAAGTPPSDVMLTTDWTGNLYLTLRDTGDSLTVPGGLTGGASRIQQIVFAD